MSHTCLLADRSLIQVSGDDADDFLQNLVTCSLDKVDEITFAHGGLLTPQGKVLFEFVVSKGSAGFWLNVHQPLAAELVRRLTFYRLRAKVDLTLLDRPVGISWPSNAGDSAADPRNAELGSWSYGGMVNPNSQPKQWHAHRIELGIPLIGHDYEAGTQFPHDILMDETGGVDFEKGCYVGQEVVSRMQHRGTARNRLAMVRSKPDLPAAGTPLEANGRQIGVMGSSVNGRGLAIVRIDRAVAAQNNGEAITASGVTVEISKPINARYEWA